MGAEDGLHVLLRIMDDGLKLVDGDKTRSVGLFEVGEDFIEGSLWHADISNPDAPFWIAVDVERDTASE